MSINNSYIVPFSDLDRTDISIAGGKNASLGELINRMKPLGIRIPDGFAIVAAAYRQFLETNHLEKKLLQVLDTLDKQSLDNLPKVGEQCRKLVKDATIPEECEQAIKEAYRALAADDADFAVAVRSSATAEDLPDASFAGQHDSFLNVRGETALLDACHRCYVSLYNDRAIKYRQDHGFDHMQVLLSIGVQRMVRSDKGSAGVAFTVDPETGHENIIYVTGAWGLGESVVQGAVNPDEFYFFKEAIPLKKHSLINYRMGSKETMTVYRQTGSMENSVISVETPAAMRDRPVLSDTEAMELARWCYLIEQHYGMPMDIEWARDGETNELFIVQARPETVHRQQKQPVLDTFRLQEKGLPVCTGKAVGKAIVSGRVCLVHTLADVEKVQQGDVIVAAITNPDWNTMLRKAVCIVTDKGGRTSHASIVARELGIIAVVGTLDATKQLKDGQVVTVDCAEGDKGYVYDGKLEWEVTETALDHFPQTRTAPMFILADPDRALDLSRYPNKGVGLLRMEFTITNQIQIHPMALVRYEQLPDSPERERIESLTRRYTDKKQYFIHKLAEAIALVAAAFYPKDVIVRMSDFKTNEYARLLGGAVFEPDEENPMLGFRGASRYYHPGYREAFGLECAAIRRTREEMGLHNVKVMVPFCRTIEEGEKVIATMKDHGLIQGKQELEIYVMAEVPSNAILAEEFAALFDGFSIGSNDLTQLTLGVDRDSAVISGLFDENNAAVKALLTQVIRAARSVGKKVGLCGQAPSDDPGFCRFLVEERIDSISFTPDALLKGVEYIVKAEAEGLKESV
ncbi:phosphoenolpyruvate synthase [Parapedobacter sp. ISTM3]|uniref:phosphoenolpyruvate synthase n=1 Tax=Parapedobacter sp. ISTM3 TaxID=2800130 RepID=UPI001904601C|nr:phosphoenolpyruvate synthase [Parapedobacter sp. ISTM3]MBK1439926.1 phosphoenolpyruvate synthase [Parapedobacter sp. ISTM3]